MELKMTEIVNWNVVSRLSELQPIRNDVQLSDKLDWKGNKQIEFIGNDNSYPSSCRYNNKWYYCGVCEEKKARISGQEIDRRNDYILKSKSKKDIVDIAVWYNRKYDRKEHHYWKCVNYCDLKSDDELINNVLVFKRLALAREYEPNRTTQHDFW